MSDYGEPLHLKDTWLWDRNSFNVRMDDSMLTRIVACVNACAGISDEELKSHKIGVLTPKPKTLEEYVHAVMQRGYEKSRDESPDLHRGTGVPMRNAEEMQMEKPRTIYDSIKIGMEGFRAQMAAPIGVSVWRGEDGTYYWMDRDGTHHTIPVGKKAGLSITGDQLYVAVDMTRQPAPENCPDCYIGLNWQVEKCGRCKVT